MDIKQEEIKECFVVKIDYNKYTSTEIQELVDKLQIFLPDIKIIVLDQDCNYSFMNKEEAIKKLESIIQWLKEDKK